MNKRTQVTHVYTESLHLLYHMSCSSTQDSDKSNPQTNNNKSTTINKYNSSDQQAAKYNRHNPALKGTSARVKVQDVPFFPLF